MSFVCGMLVLIFIRHLIPTQDLFIQIIFAALLVFGFSLLTLLVLSDGRWKFKLLISLTVSLLFFSIAQAQILNIDRSRSFYVLSWVDKGIISLNNSKIVFRKECSKEMMNPEAIKIRLLEQSTRGYVSQTGPNFHLTFLGNLQLLIAKKLATVFELNNWFENSCGD